MLQLKDITYTVAAEGGKRDVLKDVDLSFRDGAITVITGQNGSGKSTLIRLISGIECPTFGSIIYNGEDITDLGVTQRAKLGFTLALQQPVRFKGITVKKLLDLACGRGTGINDLCEYLSAVGLCAREYINREVDGSLSGGELKRIEIAMALAKGGEVFLMDEPEAGIDLWSFDELVDIFRRLKDKSVIIVSHQSKILDIADDIVLLDKSGAPLIGSREEMMPRIRGTRTACAKIQGER